MAIQIDHIVQVMFENRSFDNFLGYLYAPGDPPLNNFPPASPTTFDGLAFGGPHFNVGSGGTRFDAEQPTTGFDGHSPNVVPKWDAEAPEALFALEMAGQPDEMEEMLAMPPDDLEESIVAASEYYIQFREAPGDLETLPEAAVLAAAPEAMPTRRDAMEAMRRLMLGG